MPKFDGRTLGRMTSADASAAVRLGRIKALFQPIEALQTGTCRGFEALARLESGGKLVAPPSFLDSLGQDDKLCLFGAMLGECIALLKEGSAAMAGLYTSINVEVSLLVSAEFVDILQYFLERHDFAGERLVLEILENEEVVDFSHLQTTLAAVRRLGLSIALDDIGAGYASLAKMRDLPIDIVKLDRSFSRDLEMHPEDLMFVMSILSLARGLDKKMIVEGFETPEVYDALRVMGVELGQGYTIAAPMPADEVVPWLANRTPREASQVPRCLLGAYASHLTVVESCRVLRRQPLPIEWAPEASDHENCVIGKLFGARGWHDTAFGAAHRHFHTVLAAYRDDDGPWTQGANAFRDAMAEAISARPRDMRCDPVAAPAATRLRPSRRRAAG